MVEERIPDLRLEACGTQWWHLERLAGISLEPKGCECFVERKVNNLKLSEFRKKVLFYSKRV